MINKNVLFKYSIITVTYNCAETVERTIKSVLGQQNSLYEYLVIDGDSTDGTVDIIDGYRDRLDYYISEPDEGIYDAMNKALKHVSGDFVIFLNGDDYFISRSVLSNISKWITEDGVIVIGRVKYGEKLSECYSNQCFKSPFFNIFYPHQATFVPRKIYEEIGGFDEDYKVSADFEWICRAMYKGYKIKWIDEIVSVYSLGGRSNSLQGVIDEYCISRKYMELTNDAFINDMTEKAIEAIKNNLFRSVCSNERLIPKCRKLFIYAGIVSGRKIQLWGAGFWGVRILELLSNCGIDVECVFDSKRGGEYMGKTPIIGFEKEKAGMIIVATDIYDLEICTGLDKDGFKSEEDYFSFHKIRDLMLEAYDTNDSEYVEMMGRTGLNVLQKDS